MTLHISGLYIALTSILIFVLTYRVIVQRRIHKVGIGDGGHRSLSVAMRAHGNLLENAPIVLLLLVVAEVNGLPSYLMHVFGTIWIVARILHAIGLNKSNGGIHFGRFWGVLLSWIVMIGLAIANIGFFMGL
ncbi:MAPEG family protein [Shewanella maritima]|uniref:MAPEG family protein n=1 Tax=Shewanella maritima TaxID=2520507 RepID=UPI003735117A